MKQIPDTVDAADVTSWSDEVDVVVIGFGIAGGSAAVSAAAAGARVLVLEKAAAAGGTSAMAGGHFYLGGGTAVQEATGHPDTADEMYKYLVAVSMDPDHEKIRAYCDGSVEHFNWLEDLGFQFERSFYPGKVVVPPGTEGLSYTGNEKVWPFTEQAKPAPRGHSVPVPGELGGAAMVIDLLVKRADELGVQIRYETGATNLIVEDGAVVGVSWKHFTDTGAVKAKSVIIAAGGFALNPEMVAEHTPALGQKRRTKHHGLVEPYILGNPNDDGLGIRMGVSAGGVAKNLDQMFITAAAYPPEILLTGIIVNNQGQRFVAEDSYHSRTSAFVLEQQDQTAFLIVDEAHMQMPEMPLIRFIDGWETVEEMEKALGIPEGKLVATLRRYNENAARGEDPDFHKQPEYIAAQDTGPWAAFDLSLGRAMYSGFTMGGLAVSIDGEVLRDDGSTIPGLYAAGACASNIAQDGKGYSSGTQLGEGSFFGRRAGTHAARGLDRRETPGAAAEQLEALVVVLFERGAMADADHDAVRQLGAQRLIQGELLTLVERGGRLVEEDHPRLGQQNPGERDSLLLAGREHIGPVGDLVEPAAQGVPVTPCPTPHWIAASSKGVRRPMDNRRRLADPQRDIRKSGAGTWCRPRGRRSVPDVNGHSCARLRSSVVLPGARAPVITSDSPGSSRTSSGSSRRTPAGVRTSTSSSSSEPSVLGSAVNDGSSLAFSLAVISPSRRMIAAR